MTKSQKPYSIKIFLPDGTPEGVRILERSNWTGVGVYYPRSLFPEAKKRSEFDRTGVYILVGPSDDQGLPIVYVGQGDVVRDRLSQHYSNKEFWAWAIFFVSKDGSLNRAHVQHLESRLIELARTAKRAKLDNQAIPQLPHLTEADQADVESFLSDVLSILPLVGLTVFERPPGIRTKKNLLHLSSKGVSATGYETADGFVVREGSTAVVEETKSIHGYLTALRKDLREQEVVVPNGDQLRFTQDFAFTSPSTAAGVVLGRTANGRVEWRTSDGATLKELQEAELETVAHMAGRAGAGGDH
jgi:hypothetical protein